jgi:hypothetical protein
MRVLFLDIDGVLNSERYIVEEYERTPPGAVRFSRLIDPAAVALIDNVVARTGCDVVLSSAWRYGKDGLDAERLVVEKILRARGARFTLHDSTPTYHDVYWVRHRSIPRFAEHDETIDRGAEIGLWLAENGPVASYAIVDDNADMGPHAHRLVRTDSKIGITHADHDALIALLTERS